VEDWSYLLNPLVGAAEEARIWIDDVATNDPEGVAEFELLPVAPTEISKIEVSAAALRDAFDSPIQIEVSNRRLRLIAADEVLLFRELSVSNQSLTFSLILSQQGRE